jgi:hypothetical protein
MSRNLRTPGWGERVRQLFYLLKHTFTLVGRHPGIVRPWARTAIYAAVLSSLLFGAVMAYALQAYTFGSALLFTSLVMFIYKFFYFTRQELRQSWLVSEVLQGRQPSAEQAGSRVATLGPQVRRIAWLDMVVAAFIALARQNDKAGFLLRLIVRGLEEVWDLLNHYLLPSVAVDGLGIRDSVSRMGRLKEQVPETLVGVFGIDVAARAVGTLVAPLYLLLVVAGLGGGVVVGDSLPAFYVGDLQQMIDGDLPAFLPQQLDFSWLPLLLALWLGKLVSVAFERVAASVKVIYFSIFYMRITHLESITPDIRDELDGYLRMEKADVRLVATPG